MSGRRHVLGLTRPRDRTMQSEERKRVFLICPQTDICEASDERCFGTT